MIETGLRLLLWLGIWSCPLPLAIWLAGQDPRRHRLGHDLLIVLLLLLSCHMAIPLVLGAAAQLQPAAFYLSHLCVALLGVFLLWKRRGRSLDILPARALNDWQAGFLFLATFVSAVAMWRILEAPTRNYDSFAYHLPAICWWLQKGEFAFLPELGQTAYYAFNWELSALPSFFALQGDLLAALPNLCAWWSLGLGLYLLARELAATAHAAMAAALAVCGCKAVLSRLDAAQPDLVLSAYFLSALYCARIASRERSVPVTATAVLTLLALPGLKMSGLIYAPLCVALAEMGRRMQGLRWHFDRRALQLSALVGAWLGFYWYGRNWTLAGNPLGLVQLFSWRGELGPTELARTTLLRAFDPTQLQHWRILATGLWVEFGPGIAALSGLAIWALRGVWRHAELAQRRNLLFGVIATTLAVLCYLATPYSADNGERGYRFSGWFAVNLRFAFPCLALVGVTLAVALAGTAARWLLIVVATAILYVQTWQLDLAATTSIGAATLGLALGIAVRFRGRDASEYALGARIAVIVAATCLLAWIELPDLLARRERLRIEDYGRIYEYMEAEVPADAVVGVAGTHRIFPLFGSRASRRVVGVDPAHEMNSDWLSLLRARDVQYLALGSEASSARDSLQAHPNRFELLFPAQSQLKDVELYRLR